jgi:hypothetical protein
MIAKNMDVTRINMLYKIWCTIQKNDHMMATKNEHMIAALAKSEIDHHCIVVFLATYAMHN